MAMAEESQSLHFTGSAYRLGTDPGESSALVYTEIHQQTGTCKGGRWRPAQDSVSYREPDGAERGTKSVDYRPEPLQPSYTLTDLKFDEHIRVVNDGDHATIVYEEFGTAEPQRFKVELSPEAVIDAGFDQWVVQNWNALLGGETLQFEFLAVTRGELFTFEATRIDEARATAGDNIIRIKPAGFLAGFFVEPIFLAYDDRGYLTDYMGLGNIRKNGEANHEVHIRYVYEELPTCPGVDAQRAVR